MSKICTILVHACIGAKPTCPHFSVRHIDTTNPEKKRCRFKCLLTRTFYEGTYPFPIPEDCRLTDVQITEHAVFVDQKPEAIP